jgi:squalene-hopene/tetraprenyl-beta-curcumene cyclase
MYDSDAAKKKESRGTEAVLNALLLASEDRAQGRRTSAESTRKAFANLWETQLTEGPNRGSWDWLDFGFEPWEADDARFYGATLAAIAVGMAPDVEKPGTGKLELLRDYLKRNLAAQNDFNRVSMLWASTRLDGLLDDAGRREIIDSLVARRHEDGGWSLSSLGKFTRHDSTAQETATDAYATGLILHVLQQAGIAKDDPRVAPGLAWLRGHQLPSGAWAGVSVNKRREPESSNASKANVGKFMWDAATAYAILALSH